MAESKGSTTSPAQKQRQESTQLQTRGQRSERGLAPRSSSDWTAGSPFQMMRRMSEEMDRMFDRMFGDFGFGRSGLSSRGFGGLTRQAEGAWAPRIEAFQKDDKFIVRAELPGVKKDDVEVNITEDAIIIQGQRREEHEEQREGFYHSERSYGSFYRLIPLSEGVIADSAEATFRDGVLEIRLQAPPNEVSRGRRIEISDKQ